MPGRIDEYCIALFPNALALPPAVWKAFRANPIDANIMSAHAFDALAKELAGEPAPPNQLWIICGPDEDNVDLILSCTEDLIHRYPIFLFAPNSSAQSNTDFLEPRIECLVDALYAAVPPQRVFSVVAPNLMSNIFAGMWSHLTGIPNYQEPYYHAKLTFCDLDSLITAGPPEHLYDLRLANEADILEAAILCLWFSQGSKPFVLSKEGALKEATFLVQNKRLWIHRMTTPEGRSEIATIVAVTRDSPPVSAITKVFTSQKWRGQGCAERLVRYVCKQLLISSGRESVILFVAHDNGAANRTYEKIGFAGLDGSPVEGVSSWMEIGFDREVVELGHW